MQSKVHPQQSTQWCNQGMVVGEKKRSLFPVIFLWVVQWLKSRLLSQFMTHENTLYHLSFRDRLYFKDLITITSFQRTVAAANCNGPILMLLTFKLVEIQSFKLVFDKQKLMCKCPNQTLQKIQKSSFNLTTRVWKSTCLLPVTT